MWIRGAVAVVALAACVTIFRLVDLGSHSASDTLIGAGPPIVLVLAIAGLAWARIAARTSSADQ